MLEKIDQQIQQQSFTLQQLQVIKAKYQLALQNKEIVTITEDRKKELLAQLEKEFENLTKSTT